MSQPEPITARTIVQVSIQMSTKKVSKHAHYIARPRFCQLEEIAGFPPIFRISAVGSEAIEMQLAVFLNFHCPTQLFELPEMPKAFGAYEDKSLVD
ncbi:MAG: hypothetical protein JSV16_01925 [Candidatus Hydrogenedentota bacterium]|nr:MAG: hypothetical protein JSV16_01925 [Candidatus Hydrogenedentota bacterium]